MLYILAGASRSGKTLLARRAVIERKIPYFPLDALFGALVHGAPEQNVRYEDSCIDRANNFWPMANHLLNFFFKEERDYLLEGDSLLPSSINELLVEGKPIKCCFLGYAELTKEEKLSLVRKYHQGDVDWTKKVSDEDMLGMVNDMIEFSKYLKDECAKYGIMYFDISHDFEGARQSAYDYLFAQ